MQVNNKYKNVSNEEMVDMVKILANKLGRTPKAKETGVKYNIPSLPTYLARFKVNSWNDILSLCGLKINLEQNISIDEGLQRLLEFYNFLGRIPKQKDFKDYNWLPSPSWYTHKFGGVENALIELGLKVKKIPDDETKQFSIAELQRIAELLNRCPMQEEYNQMRIKGYPLCTLLKKFNMKFSDICKKFLDEKYFIMKDGYKICSACKEEKPLEEFHKQGEKVRSDCKVCSYFRRNKNVKLIDGWTFDEYKIIVDCILNNKVEFINDIIPLLNNKSLNELTNIINNNLKFGSNQTFKRVKKICYICNKEFNVTVSIADKIKCCSKECGNILRIKNAKIKSQENRIQTFCDFCNCELNLTQSKYNASEKHFCNRMCHSNYLKETCREVRHCEICNESFVCVKTSAQKTCSRECANLYCSINYSGENNWAYSKRIITNCAWCNKELSIIQSVNERSENHFCDKNCFTQWFRNVYSQTEEFKTSSREHTLKMLNDGTLDTNTSIQLKVNDMLKELNIVYENEKIYEYYALDNYLTNYNLLIEVQGDYFHCNPLLYKEIIYEMQLGRIYNDRTKNKYIKNNYKINILYLWESDINERPEVCKKIIKEYINKNRLKNYNSFNYSIKNDKLVLNSDIILSYVEYKKEDLDKIVNLKVINGRYIKQRNEENWLTFNCDYCGKECEELKSSYGMTINHFCCIDCHNKFQISQRLLVQCDNCKNEYLVLPNKIKNNKHNYCSKDCEFEYKRNHRSKRKIVNAVCDYCGKPYECKESQYNKTKKHYCSKECMGKDREDIIITNCCICGKELRRTPSEIKRSNNIFCSKDCETIFRKDLNNEEKWIKFNCEVCNKEVTQKRRIYNKNKHHYCSDDCKSISKVKQIKFYCEWCNKEVSTNEYQYNRSKRHFCSKECHDKFQKGKHKSKK